MGGVIRHLFTHNRLQKMLSLVLALFIWIFVYQSITATKTLSYIPVRITNLPSDMTILGLQPNGFLDQRITLTLTGTKYVINRLESSDIEVLLDAANKPKDWIVNIGKKNLVSLNPVIDLNRYITQVEHPQLILRLSPFVTEQIPVRILPPKGKPPPGYQFLSIYPQELLQTVSGPEDEVLILKSRGLELSFDLNDITTKQLNALRSEKKGILDDEVSFLVPDDWKKVVIPFFHNAKEQLNDPQGKDLQIDFLREQTLPIERLIPLNLYFSLETSEKKNPQNLSLALSPLVQKKRGITFLNLPLYARNVSKLFLHLVRNFLQLTIVADPSKNDYEELPWSLQIIDAQNLEDAFVAFYYSTQSNHRPLLHPLEWEAYLRERFQRYTNNLVLFEQKENKFELNSYYQNGNVVVKLGSEGR